MPNIRDSTDPELWLENKEADGQRSRPLENSVENGILPFFQN